MATLARFALPASLSLITISILWGGCSSSTNNSNADAAADSAKMDAVPGTPSDLAPGTVYDSSPLVDSPANTDGPFIVADALVPKDVAGKDVGTETSTDLPSDGFYDSSAGPDKPASSDVSTDKNADTAPSTDVPIVSPLDAQTAPDLAGGSVDTATGPDVITCGGLSQACCGGNTCASDLFCLAGASCSCAKTLFGRYLLRADGALLYETDPASTAQTPVLDASTGLPLANVIDALDGANHGCALLGSDHTVWCWRTAAAGNSSGQLGSGATDTSGPVFRATQVLTAANQALTNVAALATSDAGYVSSTCAVTGDGMVYCWGDNTWLTNGGTALKAPYAVLITTDGVTAFAGVLQVGISIDHACTVVRGSAANEVWCWGSNNNGQLGTGDTTSSRNPTKVVGMSNPTKVVAFGSNEYGAATCVIDGTNLRCWGSNDTGQLGVGSTTSPILAPTLVTLIGGTTALTGVVDIRGGTQNNIGANACAQTNSSSVLCWGTAFQTYPTTYGVGNVVVIGSLNSGTVRLLTSDGIYHIGSTTRSPNCGLLQ